MDPNIWMPALPYGTRNETIFGFRRKAPSPVPQRPANAGETAQILTFGRTAPFWRDCWFYHLVNAEMANRGYPEAYAAHSYYLNSLTGKR